MRRLVGFLVAALTLAGCSGSEPPLPREPREHTVFATSEGTSPHFAPDNVTIHLQDHVLFRVLAGRHTVEFESPAVSSQRSGDLGVQLPFAVQFYEPGTYRYRCEYHGDQGMTGTVVVLP